MGILPNLSIVRKCCIRQSKSGGYWTRRSLQASTFVAPRYLRRVAGSAGQGNEGIIMACNMPSASPIVASSAPGYIATNHGVPTASPRSPVSISTRTALGPPYNQHITSDFFGSGPLPAGQKMYLIVLNYCLPAGLLHVWPLASLRICADGGCNRLFDELPAMVSLPVDNIPGLEAASFPESGSAGALRTVGSAAMAPLHMSLMTSPSTVFSPALSVHGFDAVNRAGSAAAPLATSGNGCSHADNNDPNHDHVASTALNSNDKSMSARGMEFHSNVAAALHLAYLPDVVLGDLDSIRQDVQQFYKDHGVPFMDMSYDQDTNDLAKAILLIEERYIRPDVQHGADHQQILVLGALGGRLDHTLANLNVLHMFPHLNVTLWGDGNLVRLVRPGKALIIPDERFEGPTCGLIPIAGPVTTSSSGLKWNVSSTQLRVGGLVSSSNLLTGDAVEVECDGPLLWSTEIRAEPRPNLRALWMRTAAAAVIAREREM